MNPKTISQEKIKKVLASIAAKYPARMIENESKEIDRIAFNIYTLVRSIGQGKSVCDIGGGTGLFSIGCAALGMDMTLMDDFGDESQTSLDSNSLDLHRQYGVRILAGDVLQCNFDIPPDSLDAVTTFDSMEHWHHSPKRLFRKMKTAVRNNGLFLISVPNSVNLRKRITVPFGRGNWSHIEQWYEPEVFRGHVRECTAADLYYIAKDLNLKNVDLFGRNWLGHDSKNPIIRSSARLADPFLRLWPTLCSDLYLLGYKVE